MIDLDKYRRLKTAADAANTEADKAEGALEQLMAQVAERYGCKTLEEFEAHCEKLDAAALRAETKYIKELAAFEEEYGDALGG